MSGHLERCPSCFESHRKLLRAGVTDLHFCPVCRNSFCGGCIAERVIGRQVYVKQCPNCGDTEQFTTTSITERTTIFTDPVELLDEGVFLSLLFVTWSAYVRRSEKLAEQMMTDRAIPVRRLHLLDEGSPLVRATVSEWFPESYSLGVPTGAGSLLTVKDGLPESWLRGGPHLAGLEIVRMFPTAAPDG